MPSVSRRPAGLGLRQGSRGQGRGQGRERTCRCCEVLGFHSESTGSCGLTDSFRESLWLLRDCRGRACKGKMGQGGGSVPPSGHPTASGHRFRSSIWGGGGDWTAGSWVRISQGHCQPSCTAHRAPPKRVIQLQTSVVPRLRNPELRDYCKHPGKRFTHSVVTEHLLCPGSVSGTEDTETNKTDQVCAVRSVQCDSGRSEQSGGGRGDNVDQFFSLLKVKTNRIF